MKTTKKLTGKPEVSGSAWSSDNRDVTRNREKVFFSGVNYIPSHGWLTHLEIWDPKRVEEDFISLRKSGVRHIRYLPLWPQLQKSPEVAYAPALERLDTVIEYAAGLGISVQLGLLNIWLSGGTFLPPWADGNLFKDPEIVRGQKNLIRDIVSRYRGNDAIQAYDLGNELNVLPLFMKLENTPQEIESWMREIYETIKKHDPDHDVINGIGTGYTRNFNIGAISRTSDLMACHSYPFFHGTSRFDPWIGQRTTYSSNYIISWAEMTGKPVIMQEIGCSEQWMPDRDIPKYLEITFLSNWAEGAAGYLWWCSHDLPDNFRVGDDGLFPKYSTQGIRDQNMFDKLNYDMGLLKVNNHPKPAATAFKKCTDLVDLLGQGWRDENPVCYILVPDDHHYDQTMLHLIHPFMLAKQAHLDVKMLYEHDPVPEDASSVIIAGFSLTGKGRQNIRKFLDSGGIVYQSVYNDFAPRLKISDEVTTLRNPELVVDSRKGLFSLAQRIRLPFELNLRSVTDEGGAGRVLSVATENIIKEDREHDTDFFVEQQGAGVFYHVQIGKGEYYFLAADLERALMNAYGDWDQNDACLIYSPLRPACRFDVSDRQVEFYHKTRGNEEIVILINHSDIIRNTSLYASEELMLQDLQNKGNVLSGCLFHLQLLPAETRIFTITDR